MIKSPVLLIYKSSLLIAWFPTDLNTPSVSRPHHKPVGSYGSSKGLKNV